MEANVLANAIQRLVLIILTGRKHGVSAEMFHLFANQTNIMMTGDTSAFACLRKMHLQRQAITGKKQIKLAHGFKFQLTAVMTNSTTMQTTYVVAMNNLALLATTSTSISMFADADASEAFAQTNTIGMILFANASAKLRLAIREQSSTMVPASALARNPNPARKLTRRLTGIPAHANVSTMVNALTPVKLT